MSHRVFVASGHPGSGGGFKNLGLGRVIRRMPAGWGGELVEVELDHGDHVTAAGINVYPADNIAMFRRRHIPAPPFPGGSAA